MGARFDSHDITTIVKARALRLHAATNIKPKIVDMHSGSSDITQSIDAKVIETIKSPSPGPLIICRRLRMRFWPVRSCSSESQLSNIASSDQQLHFMEEAIAILRVGTTMNFYDQRIFPCWIETVWFHHPAFHRPAITSCSMLAGYGRFCQGFPPVLALPLAYPALVPSSLAYC